MKATCRKCGEEFTIPKDSVELIEDGFISREDVNICDECFDMQENSILDYEQPSDADCGL